MSNYKKYVDAFKVAIQQDDEDVVVKLQYRDMGWDLPIWFLCLRLNSLTSCWIPMMSLILAFEKGKEILKSMTLNSDCLRKVALVTGASRGIGRSIVERFASEGATVYANSRQAGSIDPICMDLSCQHSTEVIPVYYDVTDSLKTKDVFVKIMKERKQLDILVNNAGVMEDALIGMISLDLMHKIFDTNVFAVINHLQLAARLMKKGKSGSIINLSSIVGMNGNPGQSVYSASKGAVVALTKTAAKELALIIFV